MKEKIIEYKLALMIKAAGGIAPKFVSPGYNGMPDRIILLPGGHIAFAEVKAPGMKPRPLQVVRHEMLRRLGFRMYILDSPERIESIIREVMESEVHTA